MNKTEHIEKNGTSSLHGKGAEGRHLARGKGGRPLGPEGADRGKIKANTGFKHKEAHGSNVIRPFGSCTEGPSGARESGGADGEHAGDKGLELRWIEDGDECLEVFDEEGEVAARRTAGPRAPNLEIFASTLEIFASTLEIGSWGCGS